jgi:hypothetical protein
VPTLKKIRKNSNNDAFQGLRKTRTGQTQNQYKERNNKD